MPDMLDGPENLDWVSKSLRFLARTNFNNHASTLLDQYLQNNDVLYEADLFASNADFDGGGF